MAAAKCMFGVTVKKIEIIEPEIPIQEHWLPLSNLDLTLSLTQPSSFFCFKKPSDKKYSYKFMVSILKKAMAKTLVPYYPLAGEMVQNAFGEPEIFCNNGGVDFIEAYADVELPQLDLYNSDHSIAKLLPPLPRGLFSFQATELKCGGIAVGCTADHRVSDGYSFQMLLKSWSESAQGKPFSRIPSFRRSLLFPLHTGRGRHDDEYSLQDFYMPLSAITTSLQDVKIRESSPEFDKINRMYCVSAEELSKIQVMANNYNKITSQEKKVSKFQAFTAFLWKALAMSVDYDKINSKLGVVVDGRSRLGAGDAVKLKSLQAYYGNVLYHPFSEKRCHELRERPLNWVANEIRDFVTAAATKQHFHGLIDFVEAHRPEPLRTKMIASSSDDGASVIVSTSHEFPTAKMDFGWGASAFSSNYVPIKGQLGYVGTMRSSAGNGDWIVYINLHRQQLDFLENFAPRVFKPFTYDDLKINCFN